MTTPVESTTPNLDRISSATSPGVFHCHRWGIVWGSAVIQELKAVAALNDRQSARLCLHPNPAAEHQEMLIVLAKASRERPQRRTIGFDTKVVIDGRATLRYYAPDGELSRSQQLGSPESLYVHTCTSEYHSLKVESDYFVFLEILKGPFTSDTTEFAEWQND